VILEDDCLPSPDFFRFTATALDRFRTDERIMHISGSSFRRGRRYGPHTYTFSRYNHGWGWATWKRAWNLFDREMLGLERFLTTAANQGFWDSAKERRYWTRTFRQARDGRVDAWDYQWKYSLWKEGGLCLYPEKNLISNLGFGPHATNTFDGSGDKGSRPLEPLGEISHPEFLIRHRRADQDNFRKMYWGSLMERFQHRVRKLRSLWGKRS
jgi:hypothetical protein